MNKRNNNKNYLIGIKLDNKITLLDMINYIDYEKNLNTYNIHYI